MAVLKILILFLLVNLKNLVECQTDDYYYSMEENPQESYPYSTKVPADNELTHVRTKNLSGNVKLTTLQVLTTNTPLEKLNNEFENEEVISDWTTDEMESLSENKQSDVQTITENQQKVALLSEVGTKAPTDGMKPFDLMDVFNSTSGTLPDQAGTEKLITVTTVNFEQIHDGDNLTEKFVTEEVSEGIFGAKFGETADSEVDYLGSTRSTTTDDSNLNGILPEKILTFRSYNFMTSMDSSEDGKSESEYDETELSATFQRTMKSTLDSASTYQTEGVNSGRDDVFTTPSSHESHNIDNALGMTERVGTDNSNFEEETNNISATTTEINQNREVIEDLSSFIDIDEEFLNGVATETDEIATSNESIEDISSILEKDIFNNFDQTTHKVFTDNTKYTVATENGPNEAQTTTNIYEDSPISTAVTEVDLISSSTFGNEDLIDVTTRYGEPTTTFVATTGHQELITENEENATPSVGNIEEPEIMTSSTESVEETTVTFVASTEHQELTTENEKYVTENAEIDKNEESVTSSTTNIEETTTAALFATTGTEQLITENIENVTSPTGNDEEGEVESDKNDFLEDNTHFSFTTENFENAISSVNQDKVNPKTEKEEQYTSTATAITEKESNNYDDLTEASSGFVYTSTSTAVTEEESNNNDDLTEASSGFVYTSTATAVTEEESNNNDDLTEASSDFVYTSTATAVTEEESNNNDELTEASSAFVTKLILPENDTERFDKNDNLDEGKKLNKEHMSDVNYEESVTTPTKEADTIEEFEEYGDDISVDKEPSLENAPVLTDKNNFKENGNNEDNFVTHRILDFDKTESTTGILSYNFVTNTDLPENDLVQTEQTVLSSSLEHTTKNTFDSTFTYQTEEITRISRDDNSHIDIDQDVLTQSYNYRGEETTLNYDDDNEASANQNVVVTQTPEENTTANSYENKIQENLVNFLTTGITNFLESIMEATAEQIEKSLVLSDDTKSTKTFGDVNQSKESLDTTAMFEDENMEKILSSFTTNEKEQDEDMETVNEESVIKLDYTDNKSNKISTTTEDSTTPLIVTKEHGVNVSTIVDSLVNSLHPLGVQEFNYAQTNTSQISVKVNGKDLQLSIKIMYNDTSFFVPSDAYLTFPSPETINITWKSTTANINNSLGVNVGNSVQLNVVKGSQMHIYKTALVDENDDEFEDVDTNLVTFDNGIEIYFSNSEILGFQKNSKMPDPLPSAPEKNDLLAAEIAGACLGLLIIIVLTVYGVIKKIKGKTRNFKPNDNA